MDKSQEEKKRQKILIFVILILLFLLFLTSCTSSLFGTIGNWFSREEHIDIDETNEPEILLNQDFVFDAEDITVSLNDAKVFLSYSMEHFISNSFQCTTTDASIATCYVESGYVVVIPKSVGKVDVILETLANGKTYRASAHVTVTDGLQAILLSKDSDEIYLSYTNESVFSYQLHGILGKVMVSSSDESIASVSESGGVVLVSAYRAGVVEIIVSLESQGVRYESRYQLTIHDATSTTYKGPLATNTGTSSPSSKPNSGGETIFPIVYSSDNRLQSLTISEGNLAFSSHVLTYYVVVNQDTEFLSMNAVASDRNAYLSYSFQGDIVSDLTNLTLTTGNNHVYITVTAEDGSVLIYHVVIYRPSPIDNTLSNIFLSVGELEPGFQKDVLSYTVSLESNVSHLSIVPVVSDGSSSITYRYLGKEVSSLEDILLSDGGQRVEILVSGRDGVTRTYVIDIFRSSKPKAYLSFLESAPYPLNEPFLKDVSHYSVDVKHDTNTISFTAQKDEEQSTLRYEWNGKTVQSLTDLSLESGENQLKVYVTLWNGEENVYIVDVHKPIRTIQMASSSQTIDFRDIPASVFYDVYEDGIKTSDYSLSDIQVNLTSYEGDYKLYKGYVLFSPNYSMHDKTISFSLTYQNSVATSLLSFLGEDYYVSSYQDVYQILYGSSGNYKNVVLNTNLFQGEVRVSNISSGIRVTSVAHPDIYLDIVSSSPILQLSSADGDVGLSLILKVTPKGIGDANVSLTAHVLGEIVEQKTIQFHVTKSYQVVIDANGGFFDEFTDRYQFSVLESDTIDLSKYVPFRVDESGNCLYYTLKEYNTKPDGSGVTYNGTELLKEFSQDLTLYAIYHSSSQYIELEESKRLYLTDVDLFYNEEYFEKYQESNVIYPGAKGSYVITLTNQIYDEVILRGMTLEEDTICISSKGCLNMGYVVKYADSIDTNYTYFYGSKDMYQILNQDTLTTRNQNHTKRDISFGDTGISIPLGKTVEISLLWEWVSVDDALDTLIGAGDDLDYQLTLSFDFTSIHTHCKRN